MAEKFNSEDSKREFERYRKRVSRLNAYINEVVEKVGSNEVYLDKSSTFVSLPDSIWPFEEVVTENPERELVFKQKYEMSRFTASGIEKNEEFYTIRIKWEYDEESDEWYSDYHGDSFDFEEDMRYIKKCVRNGLRFWENEDPDRFLEQEEDEEGGEA